MYKKTPADDSFQILVDKEEQRLSKIFNESFSNQEKTLHVFADSIKHCDFNTFVNDRYIWNASGYLNIISLDLKCMMRGLVFSKDEWGKRIFIRMMCMLIYESLDDLLGLLGREFRNILKEFPNSDTLIMELNDISKRLNECKKNNIEKLKEIRNIASAHRDYEFLAQYNLIISLEWTEFIDIGTSYDKILNDLGAFLQIIMRLSLERLKKQNNTNKRMDY